MGQINCVVNHDVRQIQTVEDHSHKVGSHKVGHIRWVTEGGPQKVGHRRGCKECPYRPYGSETHMPSVFLYTQQCISKCMSTKFVINLEELFCAGTFMTLKRVKVGDFIYEEYY